jgi:hypothetical protein
VALISLTSKTKAYAADVMANFQKLLALHVFNEDWTSPTLHSATYTTVQRFKPTTLRAYVAGIRLRRGILADYVEDLDVDGQGIGFTVSSVPLAGTAVLVDYQVSTLDV